jgi:hypothetical protein
MFDNGTLGSAKLYFVYYDFSSEFAVHLMSQK